MHLPVSAAGGAVAAAESRSGGANWTDSHPAPVRLLQGPRLVSHEQNLNKSGEKNKMVAVLQIKVIKQKQFQVVKIPNINIKYP